MMIVSVRVDVLIFTGSKIYSEELKCIPTHMHTHMYTHAHTPLPTEFGLLNLKHIKYFANYKHFIPEDIDMHYVI